VTQGLIQRFEIRDYFGVSHPEQIIDFDLNLTAQQTLASFGSNSPRITLVTEPGGVEIPYQIIDGGKKIALRTSLDAGGSKSWRLLAGQTPSIFASSVSVVETADHIEIASGLTALRLPNFATPGKAVGYTHARSPVKALRGLHNNPPDAGLLVLAPLQGIRQQNGTWTALGPNMLVAGADRVTSASVRFLERGPLRIVAQVTYNFDKPVYQYGNQIISKAGSGFYSCKIKVEAGQPSFLFEEETDLDIVWAVNLYEGLTPDQARYRGHHSSSVELGREPDGRRYRSTPERGGLDALVDLSYPAEPLDRRFMAVWDPWVFDSGWYWQAFNSKAARSSNLLGLFAGRASRGIGAHFSGITVFTQSADPRKTSVPVFGIAMQSYRRGPDARIFPRSRFEWGLFLSSNEQLLAPEEVQPINKQMNLHGGVNLNKAHRWDLDFPEPPQGFGAAFMSKAAVQSLKQRIRNDDAYYRALYDSDPYTRPLFDAWREVGREKFASCVDNVVKAGKKMLNTLVNGEGIYDLHHQYWMGGLIAQGNGVWLDQLLADSRITEQERTSLKATALLFANVLWDEDHAPVGVDNIGVNLGNENMPLQHYSYRRFYALFLATHPSMAERVTLVENQVKASIEQQIHETGSHIGSSHYLSTSFAPTLNTILQLEQLGRTPFKKLPKLTKLAEYLLALQTPPDPRRGGLRSILTFGDAGVETTELYGVLGSGFRDADPTLSKRLMAAWRAGGKPHSAFFGTTSVMIDDRLESNEVPLGDAGFSGSLSVLRNGWGTDRETALFLLAGDHYRDHRHDDSGAISLYALGVPISTDWASFYEPHVPGAYQHSVVVPEDAIGHPWNLDGSSLVAGLGAWSKSSQELFESSVNGARARARITREKLEWLRSATVVRLGDDLPVIVIQDKFIGEDAAKSKVVSLNLMAQGLVNTPIGQLSPIERTHPQASRSDTSPVSYLPSAGPIIKRGAGVSEFGFTGRHGVDFSVFVIGEEPHDVAIGNWGVTAWGSGLTPNKEERQHILRVKSNGTFNTVIVPWKAGNKPSGLSVTRQGDGIKVTASGKNITVLPDGSWK
jgi:hypothetical protein